MVVQYIIGALLLAMAVALILLIMFQKSNQRGLSGTLTGKTDSYYGKNKGKSKEKLLQLATTIVAIAFGVLVLLMFIIGTTGKNKNNSINNKPETSAVTSAVTSEPASEEASAAASEEVSEAVSEAAEESAAE